MFAVVLRYLIAGLLASHLLGRRNSLLGLCRCQDCEAEALLRVECVDLNAAYDDGTPGLHMAAYSDSGADKYRRNEF